MKINRPKSREDILKEQIYTVFKKYEFQYIDKRLEFQMNLERDLLEQKYNCKIYLDYNGPEGKINIKII